MAKEKVYSIDQNVFDEMKPHNAFVLISAVMRYLNAAEYPDIKDVCAILGIKEERKINGENTKL